MMWLRVKLCSLRNQLCQHSYPSIAVFGRIMENLYRWCQIYDLIDLLWARILHCEVLFFPSCIESTCRSLYSWVSILQYLCALNNKILTMLYDPTKIYDSHCILPYINSQWYRYRLGCMPNRKGFYFVFTVFICLLLFTILNILSPRDNQLGLHKILESVFIHLLPTNQHQSFTIPYTFLSLNLDMLYGCFLLMSAAYCSEMKMNQF